MKRSVSIDVLAPEDLRKQIIASVRQYRAACRQVYAAVAMAKMASADIVNNEDGVKVVPLKNSEAELLTATFGRNPQRTITKNDIIPTALAFVWDSVRRDVDARWKAKDPEFVKATRGWLTINGARDFAVFNRIGIGCPAATARPKLYDHTIALKWDHEIGEVEFKIGRLDAARYYVFRNLRDQVAGWSLGTMYLTERDGRVIIRISYERPDRISDVTEARALTVSFEPNADAFMVLSGPDGANVHDTMSAAEAIAWIDELKIQRDHYENRRVAAGNPRKPWGSAAIWKGVQARISNLTERRANGCKTRNHLWTRRIATRAESWGCGTVMVKKIPETLFERHWNWSQFRSFLEYKISEIGGRVVYE